MSGEGKKKRGLAGVSNAQNIAFRYGGRPSNFSLAIGHTTHPRLGGSLFLNAMILGQMLPGFKPSERMVRAADACIEVCPVLAAPFL
ncbi:hypothetical protein ACG873_03120 [Mesorhizobium sp. AaZ16]|uniref:hypothetical protein n=1 Tax=Mesorhizobium sp. AaZ16 TaxID=3402289 RepID=UPI00374F44A6